MTSIAFTGDIAFSKYFEKGYEKPNLLEQEIEDFLCSADYVVANIEAPVTAGDAKSGRRLNHVNPPEAVSKLLEFNARIWNLANNHVVDCKAEGLRDTLAFAKKDGIQTFGAGLTKGDAERILELPVSGGIGMFGITYYRDFLKAGADTPGCITWDDIDTVRYNIQTIKRKNRWCVMVIHGGEEFSNLPLPYVRRRYLNYLEMGADIIIAHHPHVVQNYEKVGEKMIFYSLGNFIFDTDYQRKQKYSEYGVLVKLNFSEKSFTWEYLSTRVDRSANRVIVCQPPVIFTNIDDRQYQRVWPAGAVNVTRNNRLARTIIRPETAKNGNGKWLLDDVKYYGFSNAMEILWGNVLARFPNTRKSDREIIEYLLAR